MIRLSPKEDKVRAAIIGGAIGDALGAPLEGERDFPTLLKMFGHTGVKDFVHPVSSDDNKAPLGFKPGDTTDDTACVAGVIAALELSRSQSPHKLLQNLWQTQIVWGAHQRGEKEIQDYAATISNYVDTSIDWPDWYKTFWSNIGAGKGTLSALATGLIGTPEQPISDNIGCGGMMRIAPIGLLPLADEYEVIDLAMRSTALTHGADEAIGAAIMVALTIRNAFNGVSLTESGERAITTMIQQKVPGVDLCSEAFAIASFARMSKPISCQTVDGLPKQLGQKYADNHFLAIPVLAQVLYGTLIAEKVAREFSTDHEAFLQTLAYVSTISGDSDSTGAIVGNILGAAWGTKALPPQLWDKISNRVDLEKSVLSLNQTIEEMSYELA